MIVSGVHAGTVLSGLNIKQNAIKRVTNYGRPIYVTSYDEVNHNIVQQLSRCGFLGHIEDKQDAVYVEAIGIDCDRGRYGFVATKNAQVMTQNGWKQVGALDINKDMVMSTYTSIVNGMLKDFLYGVFVGDSSLKLRGTKSARFILCDNIDIEYVAWKAKKLSSAFRFTRDNRNSYISNCTYELAQIKAQLGRRDPCVMLSNNYSNLSMAIWYMDDGYLDNKKQRAIISVKRFKNDINKLSEIASLLKKNGVPCNHIGYTDGSFVFSGKNLDNLLSKICKYVPECMSRKLTEEYRNQYEEFDLLFSKQISICYTPIAIKREISDRQFKQRDLYGVFECDNYMIGEKGNGVFIKTQNRPPQNQNLSYDINDLQIGIAQESYLAYAISDNEKRMVNKKGGTIKRLYERLLGLCADNRANKINLSNLNITVPSCAPDKYIEHKPVCNVSFVGIANGYEITTHSGLSIIATPNQQFCIIGNKFVRACDLSIGDKILTHRNVRFKKEHVKRQKYSEVLVKYHPYGIRKIVDSKYEYYRVLKSHLVCEAHMNGLTYDRYLAILNTQNQQTINTLKFIDTVKYDVHHKDFNSINDQIDNLQILTKSEHGALHANEHKKYLSFIAIEDSIIKIEKKSNVAFYTISCHGYDNYIAGGFILQSLN